MADARGLNKNEVPEAVLMVEIVRGQSLMEYTGDEEKNFAKITLTTPKFVPAAKRLLGTTIIYQPLASHEFHFFESNVDYETR